MIRNLLLCLLFTTSLWAREEIHTGKIHSIVRGEGHFPHIIQLTSGRALYYPQNKNTASQLLLEHGEGQGLKAHVDERGTIKKFRLLGAETSSPELPQVRSSQSFTPTVLDQPGEVRTIFERLNPRYQRVSQCTNRAHVWAWEEFKNHGISTMKAFIFFTKSYLWENQFPWWFHVAPLISTRDGQEWVLDYRYSLRPSSLKDWSDLFIYSNRACPLIEKYSEYRQNQEQEHCYLMKRNMFYWQPLDIENEERTGDRKNEFNQQEIEWAYKEAF